MLASLGRVMSLTPRPDHDNTSPAAGGGWPASPGTQHQGARASSARFGVLAMASVYRLPAPAKILAHPHELG